MFHVKHSLIPIVLSCMPAYGQTCTLITNGDLDTYDHELAHCNGWWHPPFAESQQPPASYVHPFSGPLYVVIGRESFDTANDPVYTEQYAQPDANINISDRSVVELCRFLWEEQGMDASRPEMNRLAGCSSVK